MSLKVTQHPFSSASNSHSTLNTAASTQGGMSTYQINALHKSKRLRNESYFGRDSPTSFQTDILIPSDSEKLAKFFPFLDHMQLEEVLNDCDRNLGKAFAKIHLQDHINTLFITDSDSSTSSMSIVGPFSKQKDQGSNILSGANQAYTSHSCFANRARESKKRNRQDFQAEPQFNVSEQNFTRHQDIQIIGMPASQDQNQNNHQISSAPSYPPVQHNQVQSQPIATQAQNQMTSFVQPQQQKSIEVVFAETAVNSLMTIPSADQASLVLQDLLKSYKDQIKGELLAKEKDLILNLMRENTVLKKGVRIQNKRMEDCVARLQEYDTVLNINNQQLKEIKELKEQNQRLFQEHQRKSMNTYSMMDRSRFNHHQDHLDDPMA